MMWSPVQFLRFFSVVIFLMPVSAMAWDGGAETPGWRVVNYWSEWCGPCRKEIPMLNALSQELASDNVRIVGVNFDDDSRQVTLKIAEALGIEFPTLTKEEVDELSLRAPDVMPTTYILTPDNKVVAKLIGLQSREQMVAQLSRFQLLQNAE